MHAPLPVRPFELLCALCLGAALWPVTPAAAVGAASAVELRTLEVTGGGALPRPSAASRLSWAVRQRTSVDIRLQPGAVRLDDPALFESPFLYWAGDRGFDELGEAERSGLRRFVEYGGFLLIDDAAPERTGFDASVRRSLGATFGKDALRPLPASHTVYRAFYLLQRPIGRVEGPPRVDAVMHGGRAAVVYSRHDLGGAWARDNLGNFLFPVVPGHSGQRERAFRFGVNLVMYALCLDYKDDQVHAPFIMRRRVGQ